MFGTTLRFGPRASGSRRLALPPPTKRWSGSTIASKASSAFDTSLRHALLPIFSRWWSPHATSIDRPSAKRPWESSMCGNRAPSKNTARAHPGPQGDHQLHAGAGDDRAALHVGVVRDAGGPAEALLQGVFELEAVPRRDELAVGLLAGPAAGERGHLADPAAPDRAGEPHGHPVVLRLGLRELVQLLEQHRRRARVRGLDTHPFRDHLTVGVEDHGLQPGSPHVDRQRARTAVAHGRPFPREPSRRDASRGHRPCHPRAAGSVACGRIVDRPSPVRVGRRCPDRGADRGPVEEAP